MAPSTAADLVSDHQELERLFKELEPLLDGGRTLAALRHLDLIWARLAVHIRAEHLVMFHALRTACPDVGAPSREEMDAALSRLADDHDRFMRDLAVAVNLLKRHVAATGDAPLPDDALQSVRLHVERVTEGLEPHNALEEERVYRWLDELLTVEERQDVTERMRAELSAMPPRFSDEAAQ
jgi:hypothetical protein